MQRILVTGCSRGLGFAIAADFLAAGHRVYGCARHHSVGVNQLEMLGGERFQFSHCDFGDSDAMAGLCRTFPILDGMDVVVFNAAVGTEGILATMKESDLRHSMDVNLISPMILAREVIKGMLILGRGRLIFISSVAARTGFRGLSVYASAKAGLLGFSKSLAREYGARGIRSNVILPGFIETDMSAGLHGCQLESIQRRIPLGRLGQSGDVVGLVRFLASSEADYINGAEFTLDGGMTS